MTILIWLIFIVQFASAQQEWSVTCYGQFVNLKCSQTIVIQSAFLGHYSIPSEYKSSNSQKCRNITSTECVDDVTFNISNRCSGQDRCSFKLVRSIYLDVKLCKNIAKDLPNLYIKYQCVLQEFIASLSNGQSTGSQSDDYKDVLLPHIGGYITNLFYPMPKREDLPKDIVFQFRHKLKSYDVNHRSKPVLAVFKLKDMSFTSQGNSETCKIGELKTKDYLRIDYNNKTAVFCTLDDRKVFPHYAIGPVPLSNVSIVSNININQKTVEQNDGKGILLQYVLIYCNPINVANASVDYNFRFTEDMEVISISRIVCHEGHYLWSNKFSADPNSFHTGFIDIDCDTYSGEWAKTNVFWPLECLTKDEIRSYSTPSKDIVTPEETKFSTTTSVTYSVTETTPVNPQIETTANATLIIPDINDKIMSSDIAGLLGGVMGFVFCLLFVIAGIFYWKKRREQKQKSLFPISPINNQFSMSSMSPSCSQTRRLMTDFENIPNNLYSHHQLSSINSVLGTSSLTRAGYPRGSIYPSSSFPDGSLLNNLPSDFNNDPSSRTLPIKAPNRKKSPLFWRSCSDNSRRDSKRLSKTLSTSQLKDLPRNNNVNHDFYNQPSKHSSSYFGTVHCRPAASPIRYSMSTQRTTLYNEVPYSPASVETYLEPVPSNGMAPNSSQAMNHESNNRGQQYMIYNKNQPHVTPQSSLMPQTQSGNNRQPVRTGLEPFASVPVERRQHNRSIDLINPHKYRDRNSVANNRVSFFGMQSNHYYGDEKRSETPSDTSIYESLDDENEEKEASLMNSAPLSASLPLIPSQRQRIALPAAPVAMAEVYEDDNFAGLNRWEDSSEEDIGDPHYESEYGYQPIRIMR